MIAEEVWVILSCCVSHKPASMTCLPCQRGDKLRQRQGHIPGSGYIQILGSWLFQALNQNWLSPPGLLCLFPMCTCLDSGRCIVLRMRAFNLATAEHAQTSSCGLLVPAGTLTTFSLSLGGFTWNQQKCHYHPLRETGDKCPYVSRGM